jgi:hypothetical protein
MPWKEIPVTAIAKVITTVGMLAKRALRLIDHKPEKKVHDVNRWQVVTIARSPDEIVPDGELPEPLQALGDDIEVDVHPAPGGRGTELAARFRSSVKPEAAGDGEARTEDHPGATLRKALREAKQLAEVGEILSLLPRPEGKRPATPTGKLVDKAEEEAGLGGVL